LATAWRETTNQEMAASIMGYNRQAALGDPLVPYEQRVEKALQRILASRAWTTSQRQWRQRIANQTKAIKIVDREALDDDALIFRREGGGMTPRTRSRLGNDHLWGWAMRAKLFRNGRSQAVRLPAEFRFEGTEVEVHRDPESGAVVLTPVRPSASALLERRDALLQEPGFRAELDALFEGMCDTRPAEPVDFP
jgi:virulence-associated protein VagC